MRLGVLFKKIKKIEQEKVMARRKGKKKREKCKKKKAKYKKKIPRKETNFLSLSWHGME